MVMVMVWMFPTKVMGELRVSLQVRIKVDEKKVASLAVREDRLSCGTEEKNKLAEVSTDKRTRTIQSYAEGEIPKSNYGYPH